MKSKFILHGGFQKGKAYEDNTEFYSEIVRDIGNNSKLLIVPFAKDPERVITTTEKVIMEFNNVKGSKVLTFEVATEELFIEQLKSSEIIYIQGGTSLKLMSILKKFPGGILRDLFRKGKTVAGESAGANALCKLFYSPSADGVYEGLSVLPFRIIPHYTTKYEEVFDNKSSGLEPLYLKEYEHRVFYR